MDTTMKTIELTLPDSELPFIKTIAKKFGWTLKRGLKLSLLYTVIEQLKLNGTLPKQYRAHKLSGNYANYWECHIKGDWLLIWEQNDDELILILTSTGTHSDLF